MPEAIRVLTAADLHQSRRYYRWLGAAVAEHKPDVVAMAGDFLGMGVPARHADWLGLHEVAESLGGLPVQHLVFVRGNHEEEDWRRLTTGGDSAGIGET